MDRSGTAEVLRVLADQVEAATGGTAVATTTTLCSSIVINNRGRRGHTG